MMKRMLLAAIVAVLLIGAPAHALDLDVVTGFGGSSAPSGKFYHPLAWDMELVLGFSAEVPGQKYRNGYGRQANFDILLGINSPLPLLGNVDMYFVFDDSDGVVRTGEKEGSDLMITKFAVSKKWLYALNDRLNLGVAAILGEVLLDGTKQINVLTEIQPVIGATVSF
jgi:hypothetical protein